MNRKIRTTPSHYLKIENRGEMNRKSEISFSNEIKFKFKQIILVQSFRVIFGRKVIIKEHWAWKWIFVSLSWLLVFMNIISGFYLCSSAKEDEKKMAPIKIEKYFLPKIQFHWSGCQKAKILNMIYDYELEIYFNNLRHDGSCTRATKILFVFLPFNIIWPSIRSWKCF